MNFSWKAFTLAFAALLVLDLAWLGFIVKDFYLNQLAALGRIENGRFVIAPASAAAVYVLMALALTTFALPRTAANDPWYVAAGWGALLGLCLYGVYDFTNHATLRGWPPAFMAVDIAWGTLQLGLAAALLQAFRAYL